MRFNSCDARGLAGRSKGSLRQPGAVHTEIGIENAAAEMAHDFVVDGLAGKHQFVSNAVGLDQTRAKGNQHLSDHRFSRSDAASEADFQHKQWSVVSGRW